MADQTLVSYAQNGEDVVLWRALGHVHGGVYVDVGGWDPDEDSVTRLFYDQGWRGVDVEPVPEFAEKFRRRRPRNDVVQAAVTDRDVDHVVLHRFGDTGLSTVDDALAEQHDDTGTPDREDITVPARRLDDVLSASSVVEETIHFLKIDVEGLEDQVLRSVDLARWRPWVLVVEATEPNSTVTTHERWEQQVLDAGYTFTLFDGLSRFYVAGEHPELAAALSYPACVLDDFVTDVSRQQAERVAGLETALQEASARALHWRGEAVTYWADAVAEVQRSADEVLVARGQSEQAQRRLTRVQDKLTELREERNRLRARVKRLSARLERREEQPAPAPRTATSRVRAVVKKAVRS